MFRGQGNNNLGNISCIVLLALVMAGCAHLEALTDRTTRCGRIGRFSRAGEHQAAVEAARKLQEEIQLCSEDVQVALKRSSDTLDRADSLVREAFKEKSQGDLGGARDSMKKALKIYPRYYWVKKLLSGVERSIETRVEGLEEEAQYLEERGDFAGAIKRLEAISSLTPAKPGTAEKMAFLRKAEKHQEIRREAEKNLALARKYFKAGRLLDAEKTLQKYKVATVLPMPAQRLVIEIKTLREARSKEAFKVAVQAEEQGNLNDAYYYLGLTLSEPPMEKGRLDEVVEFARLLGLKFYAKGRFTQARETWNLALAQDPKNRKLKGYLDEVRKRLDSIEKIQEESDDKQGK